MSSKRAKRRLGAKGPSRGVQDEVAPTTSANKARATAAKREALRNGGAAGKKASPVTWQCSLLSPRYRRGVGHAVGVVVPASVAVAAAALVVVVAHVAAPCLSSK